MFGVSVMLNVVFLPPDPATLPDAKRNLQVLSERSP